jgi:hypothetical protein
VCFRHHRGPEGTGDFLSRGFARVEVDASSIEPA